MRRTTESINSRRNQKRATAACINCRTTRIRCIKTPGEVNCSQCRNSNIECIYDHRDGRKNRSLNKGVAHELKKRVEELERLLHTKTSQNGSATPRRHSAKPDDVEPNDWQQSVDALHEFQETRDVMAIDTRENIQLSPSVTEESSTLSDLAPQTVKFDMSSGRLQFFGPTTNMHIYSRDRSVSATSNNLPESQWHISFLIHDFTKATHDYLMELYWGCFNSVFHLVHKFAFYDDMERGCSQFYSSFLHVCLLAEGFRYANKSRPDIQKLISDDPQVCSILHAKAKKMAQLELEKTAGIPSIQGLLCLGDLETTCGRDDTGWMFSGMALRLVYELGMHVDTRDLNITEREWRIRHMLLWACLLNDKYWSLYLGRPTMLKDSDIAPSCLQKDFSLLLSCRSPKLVKSIETRVYEKLLQLMDLAEPLCSSKMVQKKPLNEEFFQTMKHDRKLNEWYDGLPDDLRLIEPNCAKAPASLFLLHSQFYTLMILLHRRYANSGQANALEAHHLAMISRKVCVRSAIQIAVVFDQYRARFDVNQTFSSALQHIGSAATALVVEIEASTDLSRKNYLLGYLRILGECMQTMSENFKPAGMMFSVVDHFVRGVSGASIASNSDGSHNQEPSPHGTSDGQTAKDRPYTLEWSELMNMDDYPKTSNARRPSKQTVENVTGWSAFPILPSSWFQENWDDDVDFLNLVGLKQVQDSTGWSNIKDDCLEFFAPPPDERNHVIQ